MKNNLYKDLKDIANALPIKWVKQNEVTYKLGYELLQENPDMKDLNGKPLDFKKKYRVAKEIYVKANHEKMLKELYKKGGIKAVRSYVKPLLPHLSI